MSEPRDDPRLSPDATYLTDLVEAWRRGGGDITDWASFEATPGYDRASVKRAWAASDDPFSMLLLVAAMHPYVNEPVCGALVARMSFADAMVRIAGMQRRIHDGTVYNGPTPFVLTYLAQGARRALREAALSEQGSLSRDLSAAIREVLPDPYALEDDGAPALASSVDKDRNTSAFECGTRVYVRAVSSHQGAVCRVSWNYRFHCWTYWIRNDHGEVSTRYKAEDLGRMPQPTADAAQSGAGARLGRGKKLRTRS